MPISRRISRKAARRHRPARSVGRVLVADQPAVDAHVAGIVRLEEVHASEKRALARSARPDQADDLRALDRKIDAAQHLMRAEALADPGELDHRRAHARRLMREKGGHARFEPRAQARHRFDQEPVEDRHGEDGVERGERLRRHRLHLIHELGHGDDRQHHRLLRQDDQHVDDRGNGGDQRPGQRDPHQRVERRHADAHRRFDLAGRHGGEAGAKDLGEIGRRVEAEADDAGGRGAQSQADRRAAGVEEEELHQERRASEDLDERPERPVERRDPQPVQERDREPEQEAERAARAPAQDRDAKAAHKRGRIVPEQIRAHRRAARREPPLGERAQRPRGKG